jgi:hypothetical protein
MEFIFALSDLRIEPAYTDRIKRLMLFRGNRDVIATSRSKEA